MKLLFIGLLSKSRIERKILLLTQMSNSPTSCPSLHDDRAPFWVKANAVTLLTQVGNTRAIVPKSSRIVLLFTSSKERRAVKAQSFQLPLQVRDADGLSLPLRLDSKAFFLIKIQCDPLASFPLSFLRTNIMDYKYYIIFLILSI